MCGWMSPLQIVVTSVGLLIVIAIVVGDAITFRMRHKQFMEAFDRYLEELRKRATSG